MVESTPYEVLESFEGVELRRYPSVVIAVVEGLTDDIAFRILFRYISGENMVREDISMTVPVISTGDTYRRIAMTRPVISGPGSFAFVLPSLYSITTAPRPLDGRIRLVGVGPRHLAALRFSGRVREDLVRTITEQLMEVAGRRGWEVKGEPLLMRYNGPGTPGFLRRNEVAVEVDPGKK
ncbi:MAG: heme-binding protein [Methanomassiliicoccales archaeon]|nr:heme-binding protein [Methanomassiliicoccales archaeon]